MMLKTQCCEIVETASFLLLYFSPCALMVTLLQTHLIHASDWSGVLLISFDVLISDLDIIWTIYIHTRRYLINSVIECKGGGGAILGHDVTGNCVGSHCSTLLIIFL